MRQLKTSFRIPSVDLRPVHDMDRPPWWRRMVRKDYFLLELTDAIFRSGYKNHHKDSSTPSHLASRSVSGNFYVILNNNFYYILYLA